MIKVAITPAILHSLMGLPADCQVRSINSVTYVELEIDVPGTENNATPDRVCGIDGELRLVSAVIDGNAKPLYRVAFKWAEDAVKAGASADWWNIPDRYTEVYQPAPTPPEKEKPHG